MTPPRPPPLPRNIDHRPYLLLCCATDVIGLSLARQQTTTRNGNQNHADSNPAIIATPYTSAILALSFTRILVHTRKHRAPQRFKQIRASAAILPLQQQPTICTTQRKKAHIGYGTSRPLSDSSRLGSRSARKVLLARSTTEHLDNRHVGNRKHNTRNQRAIHADTRPHGLGHAMDNALRRHSRRPSPNIHHCRDRLHLPAQTPARPHDAPLLHPARPIHRRHYRHRHTTIRRPQHQQPVQHLCLWR